MNMLTGLRYLRTITAGLCAQIRRLARGRHCPCDMCHHQRQFIRESAAAYRAEVLRRPPVTDRGA